jgi:hypothetical protein
VQQQQHETGDSCHNIVQLFAALICWRSSTLCKLYCLRLFSTVCSIFLIYQLVGRTSQSPWQHLTCGTWCTIFNESHYKLSFHCQVLQFPKNSQFHTYSLHAFHSLQPAHCFSAITMQTLRNTATSGDSVPSVSGRHILGYTVISCFWRWICVPSELAAVLFVWTWNGPPDLMRHKILSLFCLLRYEVRFYIQAWQNSFLRH